MPIIRAVGIGYFADVKQVFRLIVCLDFLVDMVEKVKSVGHLHQATVLGVIPYMTDKSFPFLIIRTAIIRVDSFVPLMKFNVLFYLSQRPRIIANKKALFLFCLQIIFVYQ